MECKKINYSEIFSSEQIARYEEIVKTLKTKLLDMVLEEPLIFPKEKIPAIHLNICSVLFDSSLNSYLKFIELPKLQILTKFFDAWMENY